METTLISHKINEEKFPYLVLNRENKNCYLAVSETKAIVLKHYDKKVGSLVDINLPHYLHVRVSEIEIRYDQNIDYPFFIKKECKYLNGSETRLTLIVDEKSEINFGSIDSKLHNVKIEKTEYPDDSYKKLRNEIIVKFLCENGILFSTYRSV